MDFVCEICYENNEVTNYGCMCVEKKCCHICINKWISKGKTVCPYCQTPIIGIIELYDNIIDVPYINSPLNIYSLTYNFLRISSGMAGLAYSN